MKLDEAINVKQQELANCKGMVYHYDNANHNHKSLQACGKLLEFGC